MRTQYHLLDNNKAIFGVTIANNANEAMENFKSAHAKKCYQVSDFYYVPNGDENSDTSFNTNPEYFNINDMSVNAIYVYVISGSLPSYWEDFMNFESGIHFTILGKIEALQYDINSLFNVYDDNDGEEFENGKWVDISIEDDYITEDKAKEIIANYLKINKDDVYIVQDHQIISI